MHHYPFVELSILQDLLITFLKFAFLEANTSQ